VVAVVNEQIDLDALQCAWQQLPRVPGEDVPLRPEMFGDEPSHSRQDVEGHQTTLCPFRRVSLKRTEENGRTESIVNPGLHHGAGANDANGCVPSSAATEMNCSPTTVAADLCAEFAPEPLVLSKLFEVASYGRQFCVERCCNNLSEFGLVRDVVGEISKLYSCGQVPHRGHGTSAVCAVTRQNPVASDRVADCAGESPCACGGRKEHGRIRAKELWAST
jgi:hypothetical protein